ncbi:hypothetical protein CA13_37990 [Planctomycetes bacterium CA13]|uniref:Uncharacterized protein n=1 Tax=Novipirellula herctigrandis TaxID=2527986 RepID=A0A5C5Z5K7_9BACT|nr:hypothetical protein CA13_37990 [Planctomycetes bacterium CA13]
MIAFDCDLSFKTFLESGTSVHTCKKMGVHTCKKSGVRMNHLELDRSVKIVPQSNISGESF